MRRSLEIIKKKVNEVLKVFKNELDAKFNRKMMQ
jgi:hypothetical protein